MRMEQTNTKGQRNEDDRTGNSGGCGGGGSNEHLESDNTSNRSYRTNRRSLVAWAKGLIRYCIGPPSFDPETRQYNLTGHWAASGRKTHNW